ncbi:MAG: DUF3597 domain-containing protein [Xanthobacteraceae bacterium]|jgi:3-oxoacyl-ACP reductase-like protein
MSILGSIVTAIFHHAGVSSTAQAAPSGAAPSAAAPSSTSAPTTSPAASAPSMPPKPATPVDVEAVLTKLAAQNTEKLDWRKSIVDLMKLLNLDSSLTARKQLASELHYSGDQNDSAAMNIWLHQQVMQKLAENGGKVPDALLRK